MPRYFTSGLWRGCAGDGGVLVPVPLPEPRRPDSMRWAAAADVGFALPEGSFIGPYGDGGRASLGAFPRPTSLLLAQVADTGQVPAITDAQRGPTRARTPGFWGARCFVLAPQRHDAPLRETVERLLGFPPQRVADVDVWKLESRPAFRRSSSLLGRTSGVTTGERLARPVQFAERHDLAPQEQRQRPVDDHADLAVQAGDPAHVVGAVHEPGRQALAA